MSFCFSFFFLFIVYIYELDEVNANMAHAKL